MEYVSVPFVSRTHGLFFGTGGLRVPAISFTSSQPLRS